MREYVALLNAISEKGPVDLEATELFWIERVRAYFAGKPFKIKLDSSRSLRSVVREIVEQAAERQKTMPGMHYAGAVLQHMVGAKLDCVFGERLVEHNSFTTADAPGARAGDFVIGDVAVHVTTSPGEAVIAKCRDNLDDGLRPVLVTLRSKLPVAEGLAENLNLGERIDVFEIEQFVALNLYEIGKFVAEGRRTAVADLAGCGKTALSKQVCNPFYAELEDARVLN